MPSTKNETKAVLAILGDAGRKAFEKCKGNPVRIGSGDDLPGGIENGIAQLFECTFKKYNTGENKDNFYLYAAGTIATPQKIGDISLVGRETVIKEPLCSTPKHPRKNVDAHVEWIIDLFRRMGVEASLLEKLCGDEEATFDDLKDAAKALKVAAPHFEFSTSQDKPATKGPYKDKPAFTQNTWKAVVEYTCPDVVKLIK